MPLLFAWLNEQANPLGTGRRHLPVDRADHPGRRRASAVVIAYELVRRRMAAAEQRALRQPSMRKREDERGSA